MGKFFFSFSNTKTKFSIKEKWSLDKNENNIHFQKVKLLPEYFYQIFREIFLHKIP